MTEPSKKKDKQIKIREPEFIPQLAEFKKEEIEGILQAVKNKIGILGKKPGQLTIDHFSGLNVENTRQILTDLVKKLVKEGKFYTSEAKRIVKKRAPDWLINMNPREIQGYVTWGKIRWELKKAGYSHSEAGKLATDVYNIKKQQGWPEANNKLEELKEKAKKRKKPI